MPYPACAGLGVLAVRHQERGVARTHVKQQGIAFVLDMCQGDTEPDQQRNQDGNNSWSSRLSPYPTTHAQDAENSDREEDGADRPEKPDNDSARPIERFPHRLEFHSAVADRLELIRCHDEIIFREAKRLHVDVADGWPGRPSRPTGS